MKEMKRKAEGEGKKSEQKFEVLLNVAKQLKRLREALLSLAKMCTFHSRLCTL